MAALREQLALMRERLGTEKPLRADLQAKEQKMRAEKTAYLEYEERLRQELAGLERELHEVRSATATSKANIESLLEERKAWDPEYLAQLDSLESANSPSAPLSPAVSKASTNSSAPGPVSPAVSRPVSGLSVDDTSSKDASSAVYPPAPGLSSFASSSGPPAGSSMAVANPATDDNVDPTLGSHGAGNSFDGSYGDFYQDGFYFHDEPYSQNDNDNGNEDSGIGLDESLSGEVPMDVPRNAVIATPAFGAPAKARTWDPKYLAASANAEDFVVPMPSGLEFDNRGLIVRDYDRTDPLFDYDLSERRTLYRYGWNPDALDNDIFPPHSDEAHLMEAVAAAKDNTLAYLARAQELASVSGYGDTKDCCPQNLFGLGKTKNISYRCPHTSCKTARHQWTIPYYRIAALCRLERSEYWKISLPRTPETTTASTAFDASAECCVYQGENHCVTHVHLETSYYNTTVRTSHHNGKHSCHCPIPCVGKCVIRFWTEQDYQMLDGLRGSKLLIDRPVCQSEGCNRKCRLSNSTCDECLAAGPNSQVTCQFEGCKNKPTPDIDPTHCNAHSRICNIEGCNRYCRTLTNGLCDECRNTKVNCQFDGCKVKFLPDEGSYCKRHFAPCCTEGCPGRRRSASARCDDCVAAKKAAKGKRKTGSDVVREGENEEGNNEAQEPASKRSRV